MASGLVLGQTVLLSRLMEAARLLLSDEFSQCSSKLAVTADDESS
jgi:hypothetical protein